MKLNAKVLLIAGTLLLVFFFSMFLFSFGEEEDGDDFISSSQDPTLSAEDGDGLFSAFNEDSLSSEKAVDRLERYKEWAKYPPFSRPLSKRNADLINPYDGRRPPLPVLAELPKGCQDTGKRIECEKDGVKSGIQCEFSPESSISVGKKDFKLTLFCANEGNEFVSIKINETKVYRKLFGRVYNTLPPVSVGPSAENPSFYEFVVRPTSNDWGQMYVKTDIEVEGIEHTHEASWYSTPHIVAKILKDRGSESIVRGSLVISIPVQINKEGDYEFQANLQHKEEERFIAHAIFPREGESGELKVGLQNIELEFFGKIIVDKGLQGEYIVRELRGKRNNDPVSREEVKQSRDNGESISRKPTGPPWEFVEPVGTYMVTRSYDLEEFSNKEWDSGEKRSRTGFLNSLIK